MSMADTSLYLHLTWDDLITGEHHEQVDLLPITIGRAASVNRIVLSNKQVSRQHALLESVGGKLVIIDQDTTNGTIVKGRRIKCATLDDGSTFQIQPFNFTVTTLISFARN